MARNIRTVVLDANALLLPFQFKINIDLEIKRLLGETEVLVPSSVIDELAGIRDGDARAALSLAAKYRRIEVEKTRDEGVLEAALKHDAAVITNDRRLIEILRTHSVPVIRMKKRKYLDFA